MGLDEGLLAELSDGSVESANILQGIVDDGGTKIQELNEKFREVSQGKEDFAKTVAEMQTDFSTAAGAIVSDAEQMVNDLNMQLDAYGAGADTIQGYIDGLNSKAGRAWRDRGQNQRIHGQGREKRRLPRVWAELCAV